MTLLIPTASHGVVESGFLASFTGFSRLGEYCFPTESICYLGKYLADHSSVFDTEILGYDTGVFMDKFDEFLSKTLESYISTGETEIEEGKVSIEDMLNLNQKGELLNVSISNDEEYIAIDDHVLKKDDFKYFISYLAHGGFMGWDDAPDYASGTLDSINNSERPLYK